MLTVSVAATTLAEASAFISLGGGLYETIVVNPYWPARPDIIQPGQGYQPQVVWILAHTLLSFRC